MKIAVFIDNVIDANLLDSIKKYFVKKDILSSVFLSNLHVMQHSVKDTAVINRYHLRWNNVGGSILFVDINDAVAYAQDYKTSDKYLLIAKEDLKNLTQDIITNCEILIKGKNNQIRKAKNAELQSNVRH